MAKLIQLFGALDAADVLQDDACHPTTRLYAAAPEGTPAAASSTPTSKTE